MGFLDKLFGKKAKDESHQRIHFDEGLCDKCGCPNFEYDSFWNEYSCKNCGWVMKDEEKIPAIQKNVKDESHQRIDLDEDFCDKCGSSDFEYDSSWDEYSCKSCGWILQDGKNIPAIQKKIKDGSNQRVHFNFLILDYDDKIPENKWYQKPAQKNKYFFYYRGTRTADWKWAEDSKLKVAGISHGTRTLDFVNLAFLDDFKMYLEAEPDNPVDPNAKKIMASGTVDGKLVSKHVGYLPKGISKKYAGVEIDIQPTSAFLPDDYKLNVGVEIGLFVRSARYLKK